MFLRVLSLLTGKKKTTFLSLGMCINYILKGDQFMAYALT